MGEEWLVEEWLVEEWLVAAEPLVRRRDTGCRRMSTSPGRMLKTGSLYFIGRALKSERLIRSALAADQRNFQSAEYLYRRGIDEAPLLAFLARNLGAVRGDVGKPELQTSDERRFVADICRNLDHYQSQIFQDVFVLWALGHKRDGYFVEIGVGDGRALSNTYMLEKNFGWRGLLAEPNPAYQESIRLERSAVLDSRAVYSSSGQHLDFSAFGVGGELSGLTQDLRPRADAAEGQTIKVETVSLMDLLDEHKAPRVIDYISVDTEGSELEILKTLDTSRYVPLTLTVEHNFDGPRISALKALLEPMGYRQVLPEFSRFDIWFVHESVPIPPKS
jgi:FkbM family methyltransferase